MTRVDGRLTLAMFSGAATAVAISASPAAAHVGHPTDGLFSGATHPLLGVDHILAMVTVGILAVTLDRAVRVPAAFLAAMALGGALGIAELRLPAGETAIALSVVALGGALVAGRVMQPALAVGLVGLAGFAHGHAHGVEVPAAAHPATYIVGFLVATAMLHVSGIGVGFGIQRRPRTRVVLGALVAGAGVGLVAGVL